MSYSRRFLKSMRHAPLVSADVRHTIECSSFSSRNHGL